MLIKKLAVPLINDKILIQAEHCYIATAAISEAAFDFVKARLSPKCKINIVTGLDVITSPQVLKRIWRHYQDRITLNIYTRNSFHANVYIFDLPYKKSVAFVGSGNLTMDGLKDQEELFYKISDPKEIEGLMSWYTGYFEFAEPLTETIVQEYELIYPEMKQREIDSKQLKKQMVLLTTGGFNWEGIKFKNQYFKKEDFLTFTNSKAILDTEKVRAERLLVSNKLLELHSAIADRLLKQKLIVDTSHGTSTATTDYVDKKVRAMWITYKNKSELHEHVTSDNDNDDMTLKIIIRQKDVGVWFVAGKQNTNRLYFQNQMQEDDYRSTFFKLLTGLGIGYWIEVSGDTKPVESFQNQDALWEFTKSDIGLHYPFVIGKNYHPGDIQISSEDIFETIIRSIDQLVLIYNHFKS